MVIWRKERSKDDKMPFDQHTDFTSHNNFIQVTKLRRRVDVYESIPAKWAVKYFPLSPMCLCSVSLKFMLSRIKCRFSLNLFYVHLIFIICFSYIYPGITIFVFSQGDLFFVPYLFRILTKNKTAYPVLLLFTTLPPPSLLCLIEVSTTINKRPLCVNNCFISFTQTPC